LRIVLASASPRRHEILAKHGVCPLVLPSDAEESLPEGICAAGARAVVEYLAERKARAVGAMLAAGRLQDSAAPDEPGLPCGETLPDVLLAADTIVYDGGIIGKPVDEEDAFRILASLRGGTHEVWTGVTLLRWTTGEEHTFSEVTRVTFGDFSDEDIRSYVRRERPFDKAGAYAIQSDWGRHVLSVDGDYENVMGLPWAAVEQALRGFGCCGNEIAPI
jgi:septum formation protein